MLVKFVPDAVFSEGAETSEAQKLNMLEKFVPDAVFSNGTETSE